MANPKVYFDISTKTGRGVQFQPSRVVIELFADETPLMAEDFRLLCTGEMGEQLHYKGCDFTFYKSIGACSVTGPMNKEYKGELGAENFSCKHSGPGTVWMLGGGRGGFCIFPSEQQQVQGRQFMVGRVVTGLELLKALINIKFEGEDSLVITDCGQLSQPEVSKRPREELVGMMLNVKKQQLLNIGREFQNAKEQIVKANATHFSKKQIEDMEEMANSVRHNINVLNALQAAATSLKEHQSELLGEMDEKISKLKEGKVILEAIPSLPNEVLDDIESAIKKLKSDRSQ